MIQVQGLPAEMDGSKPILTLRMPAGDTSPFGIVTQGVTKSQPGRAVAGAIRLQLQRPTGRGQELKQEVDMDGPPPGAPDYGFRHAAPEPGVEFGAEQLAHHPRAQERPAQLPRHLLGHGRHPRVLGGVRAAERQRLEVVPVLLLRQRAEKHGLLCPD